MSRKYEKYTDTIERERLAELRCDLCGRVADKTALSEWGKDSYDVAETEVSMKTGTSYPEGGNSTTLSYDICTDCFKSKLIPWMESQGATVRETKSDW